MAGLITPKYGVTKDNLNPTNISYTPSNMDKSLVNTSPGVVLPQGGGKVNWSYIQGARAAKEDSRADQAMAMQQQYANQSAQKFQWEGQDREKQQAIQAGMAEAAKTGGYSGVVAYLQNADPEMAMKFEYSKNKLDQSMMETEAFQLAHANDKAKVLMEGYGIMGKMGYALLNAAPEDRDEMYQGMLPMIKAVNPNAPDTLDEKAAGMLMLGAAQAMPTNQLFLGKQNEVQFQSRLGQTLLDVDKAASKWGTDSEQVKSLQISASELATGAADNQVQMLRLQQQQANTQVQGEDRLRTQAAGLTKEFATVNSSYQAVQAAGKSVLDENGDTIKGPDDMNLIYNYMKMLDPNSVILPGEYANASNTGGLPDWLRQKYNKALDGSKLSDDQRKAFMKSSETLIETKRKQYNQVKLGILDIAQERGYNPNNVFINRMGEKGQELPSGNANYSSEQLQKMAEDAISKGADKEKVAQRIQELQAKQQNNTQGNF